MVIAGILTFCLLIIIHEAGHYVAARLLGASVAEFSVGFGPRLFSRIHRGIRYSIACLPFGGFVRMTGEGATNPAPGSLIQNLPHRKRIAIAAAGPMANLFFAVLINFIVSLSGAPLQGTLIGEVVQGLPAASSGIAVGDKITAVAGKAVSTWEEFTEIVNLHAGASVNLDVERGDSKHRLTVQPARVNGRWVLGLKADPAATMIVRYPLLQSAERAITLTSGAVVTTAAGILSLASGSETASSLGGPVLIVQAGADQASIGWQNLLLFGAFLSTNLFLLNLIPLPILDGGVIAVGLLEAATGRKAPARALSAFTALSVGILVALLFLASVNDFQRLFR